MLTWLRQNFICFTRSRLPINALIAALLIAYASTCQAAIILDADSVFTTSNPSSSTFGTVDIFVLYDGLSPPSAMVGAYNFELNLVPAATGQVRFIDAVLTSPATSSQLIPREPLFAGQNPLEITINYPLPGQNIQVADNLPGMNASTPLINNRALATIRYEVLAGASGTFNFTIEPSSTFLIDGSNDPIAISQLLPGSITVTAIPEPGTILFGSLFVGIVLYRKLPRVGRKPFMQ